MFYIVAKNNNKNRPIGEIMPDCDFVRENKYLFTECDGKPFGKFPKLDKILKKHGYKNIPDLTCKVIK